MEYRIRLTGVNEKIERIDEIIEIREDPHPFFKHLVADSVDDLFLRWGVLFGVPFLNKKKKVKSKVNISHR